jgi:hypothetical protein
MPDPLEKLLVRAEDLNRDLLARVLQGRVRIDADTGRVLPGRGWAKLTARRRILLYLLARKAATALGVPAGGEAAAAKVVEDETGVKAGTVRRNLRELLDEGALAQDAKRRYYVPPYALEHVSALVAEEQSHG